jgi:ribosomal protein L21
MYAVIKTGGKQYRVSAGDKLKVEKLAADVGAEVTLAHVLALGEGESVKVGAPLVAGAAVKATVLQHGCGAASITRNPRVIASPIPKSRLPVFPDKETLRWHTRKQAAARAMAAIPSPSASV